MIALPELQSGSDDGIVSSLVKFFWGDSKCRVILAKTDLWDPNEIYLECIDAAKRVGKHKMELFHSVGKAAYYEDVPAWRNAQL